MKENSALPFAMLRSGLFMGLSSERFDALVAAVSLLDVAEGAWVFREGEVSDALYIVLSGAVQVVTSADDGLPIVLARLGPGTHFGEQALLATEGVRSASVRTAEASTLVRVGRDEFEACMSGDPALRGRLEELGRAQREEKMARRTELVRALLADAKVQADEVSFRDNQVLFRQGDAADAVYVVLSGKIGIYVDRDGRMVWLSTAGPGSCIGELGALRGTVRAATAIASDPVRALRIAADRFASAVSGSSELLDHVATLERAYTLPYRGFVTQHAGRLDRADCVTMLYHLTDGRRLAVWHLVGADGLRLEADGVAAERKVQSSDGNIDVDLREDGRIARIAARGVSETISELVRKAIDDEPVTEAQQDALRQEGVLRTEVDGLLCRCLRVSLQAVRGLVRQGSTSLERIQEQSGCGTVCGSCVPALEELLGKSAFLPVVVAEARDVALGVRAFRLEATDGEALPRALPGQHVVLRASVRGRMVERPYTLSSAAGAAWEVTVKREPEGVFSGWLFEHARPGTALETSQPRGDFAWDGGPAPVVCFVAGIGVTPALSFLRTLLSEGWPHRLVIDWSGRTEPTLACINEVQGAARDRSNVTLRRRLTASEPRLSKADAAAWAIRFPSAVFFVCGPEGYNQQVSDWLLGAGIPPSRVRCEKFVAAGALPRSTDQPSVRRPVDLDHAHQVANALRHSVRGNT